MDRLLEANWTTKFGKGGYKDHYFKHVLMPGERFNPEDPKFPYMSEEDYVNEAKELTLQSADKINSNSNIVGFVLQNYNDIKKIIKIRWPSKWDINYADIVIYNDNDSVEDIYTFFLGKLDRLGKYESQYVYDLYSQGGPDPKYESLEDIRSYILNYED